MDCKNLGKSLWHIFVGTLLCMGGVLYHDFVSLCGTFPMFSLIRARDSVQPLKLAAPTNLKQITIGRFINKVVGHLPLVLKVDKTALKLPPPVKKCPFSKKVPFTTKSPF